MQEKDDIIISFRKEYLIDSNDSYINGVSTKVYADGSKYEGNLKDTKRNGTIFQE